MNRNPSASGLDRAIKCPASAVLPQVRTTGDAAERGTACHNFLERIALGATKDESLRLVPEQYRDWCDTIDLAAVFADVGTYAAGRLT